MHARLPRSGCDRKRALSPAAGATQVPRMGERAEGNPHQKLTARVAHNLIFAPTAIALYDLSVLASAPRANFRFGRTGLLAGLAYVALDGVTRLSKLLDRGSAARTRLLALATYPPSMLLAGGLVYLPGRLVWMTARVLGARPMRPQTALVVGMVPFAVSAWGAVVAPKRVRRPTIRIQVSGLPRGFEGLRIAHLSDLHVGPFLSEARLCRLMEKVQTMNPELVVVTGDIVNSRPAEAVLAARALASLRAPLGVFAILGNHDRFIDGDRVEQHLRDAGIRVLSNEGLVLERGGDRLWLCGVDDSWTGRSDFDAAMRDRPAGMPTLLLAHDPDHFPEAARRGVALTLSGHTHGGQLAVPFLKQVATARAVTRFVAGQYRIGQSRLFVSRGSGVVVPPIRIGAPPEIPLLVLERAAVIDGRKPPLPIWSETLRRMYRRFARRVALVTAG